jgi:hypothetical protein
MINTSNQHDLSHILAAYAENDDQNITVPPELLNANWHALLYVISELLKGQ